MRAPPATPSVPGAESRLVRTRDLTLHVLEAGEGPAVVLLHGFPEFSWSWRHQIPALAAAGFRAIAVDLRGSGRSDRPRPIAAYHLGRVAEDVVDLLEALGVGRASAVVGHDWGGAVGYRLAASHPRALERLVVLNAPHPESLARGLLRDRQALRSAYMIATLAPGLAERALAARDGALLRATLRAFRAGPVPDEELAPYVEMARGAEWLRGGLNLYRAMAAALGAGLLGRVPVVRRLATRGAAEQPRRRRIDLPVLVIWGEADPFLAPHLAAPPPHLVPAVRVERIRGASHDVMLDVPGEVNALIVEFLGGRRAA